MTRLLREWFARWKLRIASGRRRASGWGAVGAIALELLAVAGTRRDTISCGHGVARHGDVRSGSRSNCAAGTPVSHPAATVRVRRAVRAGRLSELALIDRLAAMGTEVEVLRRLGDWGVSAADLARPKFFGSIAHCLLLPTGKMHATGAAAHSNDAHGGYVPPLLLDLPQRRMLQLPFALRCRTLRASAIRCPA
jgi:hypothetical protein